MKLGIIEAPGEKGFQHAAQFGLSFVEYCINVGQDVSKFAARVNELEKLSSQYDIAVGSIGRWGTDKVNKDGSLIEEEVQNSFRLVDVCAALGTGVFNTGVNFVEELSHYANVTAAIQYLERLCEYGEKKGVKIATYNCAWNNYVTSDPIWTLVHGHIPALGIKYDSSHCIHAHRDYLAETQKWGHRFYHVHIKGALMINNTPYIDPPAGMDQTNWGAFIATLCGVGYDGQLSLEPHTDVWVKKGQLDQTIALSAGMIRRYLFE